MKKKVAIVIPNYRESLKWNEDISLRRSKEVFNKYDVIFIHPEGLNLAAYEKYNIFTKYIALKPKYFTDIYKYSRLMSVPYFYRNFLEYDYILICQLDTFIFENNLEEWCDMNYDYIGAPWLDVEWIKKLNKQIPGFEKIINRVGNGGLSLRKVKTFYKSSIWLYPLILIWKKKWAEDFFWSTFAKKLIPGFKTPDVQTALKFAFEEQPHKCYELNGCKLPFGCHAWERYDMKFWVPHFKKYGYDISDRINK